MTARRPVARAREGFTLVSVLIAVFLLTFALMAMQRVQSSLIRDQSTSATHSAALQIARSYVEQVRTRDPWTLADEAAVRVDLRGRPDAAGPLSRSLAVTVLATNLVRISVTLEDTRDLRATELVTHIYRGIHTTPP